MIETMVMKVRPPQPTVGVEALARIRAEAALVRAHDAEYRKLLARGDQVVIISDILARDKLINAVQMRVVE